MKLASDSEATMLYSENPQFLAWTRTLPATHWARYDLSACRLGWEARDLEIEELKKRVHNAEKFAEYVNDCCSQFGCYRP